MALKFISQAPDSTVHYELNDLRPMQLASAAGDTVQSQAIPGLMVLVVEYADGFLLLLFYDAGKYDDAGAEAFLSEWMRMLDELRVDSLDTKQHGLPVM